MSDSLRKLVIWMHSDRFPTWSIPDASVSAVEEALGPGWEVKALRQPTVASGDGSRSVPSEVLREVKDAEVYFGFGIPREIFRAAPSLRWVHSAAAGVRASLFPEMRESAVLLSNSAGIYAEPLAEWAIAAMLYFARSLDVAATGKRNAEWSYERMAGFGHQLRELAGSTVGIVGYGGIGSAIGRRAAALGMTVLAVRSRTTAAPPEVVRIYTPDRLDALLPRCHYIALSLPETADTMGLIGTEELALMPSEAVLMNLSRGGIVDEDALVEALRSGRLRGAALDVFREEPLPAGSPLWDLDNVLITPHAGSITPRFWERQTALMVRNIGNYLAAARLENAVDKGRGY
jgi:phosphoglycerate dehydrogenase-like enzyme